MTKNNSDSPPTVDHTPRRRKRWPVMVLMILVFVSAIYVGGSAIAFFAPVPQLPDDVKVDRVVVIKHKRRIQLQSQGEVLAGFRIALGASPKGHKQFEGDEKTPEGDYVLDWRNPNSRFHRSIHISYPNAADRAFAAKQGKSAGGAIMIHGFPNGTSWWQQLGLWMSRYHWTDGCIAVTDPQMDLIWEHVPNGTPIEIRP